VKCPECGTWTIVKETRISTGNTRRRRLECANEHRFTTLETIVDRKTPIRKKQETAEDGGKS
jgi:transcriptional regulator NrdR family protein